MPPQYTPAEMNAFVTERMDAIFDAFAHFVQRPSKATAHAALESASRAVAEGFPDLSGPQSREMALMIVAHAWDRVVTPFLPLPLRPLSPLLRAALATQLERVYRERVAPRRAS